MAALQHDANSQTDEPNHESSVALKAALNIAERWAIQDAELATLLGGVSVPTVRHWKRQLHTRGTLQTALTRDQFDRTSCLLGIYKALHILFPDKKQADAWVQKNNDGLPFRGRCALDIMLDGSLKDLQQVLRYLNTWRA